MADTPEISRPNSVMPYIWATVILFLLGVVFIAGVLYIRPTLDPLVVITSVMGFVITISTGIAAFLKSQETHLTVNSQLTAWKDEFRKLSHAQGMIEGTEKEQDRIVEQKRVSSLVPENGRGKSVEPTPVEIVSPTPLPVTEVKK